MVFFRFWKWLSQEHSAISALSGMTAIFAGIAGVGFGLLTVLDADGGSASAQLEQQAVSIERRLGDDAAFYDVRNIVVASDEVREKLPESEYIESDGFYALQEDDLGAWEYEEMFEADFYRLALGEVQGLDELPDLRLHLWRTNHREMTAPIAISLFDYVFVERVPHEDIADLFRLGAGSPEAFPLDEDTPTIDEAVEQLESVYRGDSTGVMLQSQMPFLLPTGTPDVRPVLNSIQKKGNVVYVQATIELTDAVVDGEEYRQYFIERELMMVSTETDLWLIQTSVATLDRLSESFQWLDDWFLRFGIVGEV